MDIALLWPAALTLLLFVGAISDIRDRRLPNWLSLALLLLGLAHAFYLGGLSTIGWHLAHALIAMVVGAGIFAAGIMGGGDAKFYAGLAAFFPLSEGLNLLLWVSIAGIVSILSWMVLRRVLPLKKPEDGSLHAKFPYGVAIAIGGVFVAWTGLVG
uniref:A24 family peptidase n=1 Tax=uncultured Altererythrobacter sp. TaxID=500840 RepID=UPI00261641EE|nr:prepilin peptidase [uncultured Altererythrobacter sp.]